MVLQAFLPGGDVTISDYLISAENFIRYTEIVPMVNALVNVLIGEKISRKKRKNFEAICFREWLNLFHVKCAFDWDSGFMYVE